VRITGEAEFVPFAISNLKELSMFE